VGDFRIADFYTAAGSEYGADNGNKLGMSRVLLDYALIVDLEYRFLPAVVYDGVI